MLSKCANPACTASFRYLHDGKLFRMEVPTAFTNVNKPPEYAKKPPQRTEFFWLCERCSTRMTLVYNQEAGVITQPLPSLRTGAAL
jgi:hypothetical protein